MEHFVRIVMEKDEKLKKLDESILPNNEVYESEFGASIVEIPLERQLSEEEATEYANKIRWSKYIDINDWDKDDGGGYHSDNFQIMQKDLYRFLCKCDDKRRRAIAIQSMKYLRGEK